MIYFIIFISVYLSIGFGFALASWLTEQEKRTKNKLPTQLNPVTWVVFILGWLLFAIYCYRAEVKRTVPTYHYFMEDKDDK